MNQILSKSLISTTNFYEHYENFMTGSSNDDRTEFFDVCGKQHYRLLSYLSTLFNSATIIDIGTHRGQSALALSYNPRNVIHTFDIESRVTNEKIKNVSNINFHWDNLFEDEGRAKWKETILSSSFIFLDVDPHNGTMEIDMYNYLKEIGYMGFVVCDDIWHFKDMRDKFWYKIPVENKCDVSELGHFSGTGIFTFNKKITFNAHIQDYNENWTLVTAYFNLTKCKDASYEIKQRGSDYYMSHALSTLNLPYNLVIYCDPESIDLIKMHRPEHLSSKTTYIIREFDDMEINGRKVSGLREVVIENRAKHPYLFDNRNTASYYLFCMTRYAMMNEVIERNEFGSTHFCWINFCIERMGISNVYRLNESLALNRDRFSTCYIDYIPYELVKDTKEYFKFGRCSMCSGFFTGNGCYMSEVCQLIQDKFSEFLIQGYGHADEQLYSPVYFEHPELFEQYFGDYTEMITNYKQINENIIAPVQNFIRNSYEFGNYRMCAKACDFVLKSHNDKKCHYDDATLKHIKDKLNNCILRM